MPRPRVALIGAGLIGRSWAIVFARGGCEVRLFDADEGQLDRALGWCTSSLEALAAENLIADPDWVRTLISPAPSMADAVTGIDHVQESVGEELQLKKEVLTELDRLTPMDAVIASSTSAFMPSLLFSELHGRHRCVVAHPMNPPHLAPVVEICGGPFTYPETLERTRALMQAGGQVPIDVKREVDGFILNRLQHAVLNEAFHLVADGYVSARDLDETVRNGLALRWSFMGPLETIDLNAPGGTADYMARYGDTIRRVGRDICNSPPWPESIAEHLHLERRREVPLNRLEDEAKWRDRRMMALARHKQEAREKLGK
jgi:3-hydroxyacyl-CoA dehydrogenase